MCRRTFEDWLLVQILKRVQDDGSLFVSVWGAAPSRAQHSIVTVVQGCLVARQYAASILRYSHAQQGHLLSPFIPKEKLCRIA